MYEPSGDTITLSADQRKRAKKLLRRVIDGDVQSPTDVVAPWKKPDSTIDRERKESHFPQDEGFVSPSAIAGSIEMSHRLEKHRLKKVLAHMLKGKYEVQSTTPPILQRRGDQFYVTTDGNHRCMVARAIRLDELYAEYTIVPPELLK